MPILGKTPAAKTFAARTFAAKALMALALGACAEPWPEAYTWPGQDPYIPELAYCYVTLGNVDCFADPQPGQAYRQVGRAIIAPH
jgi:hypothetical protein